MDYEQIKIIRDSRGRVGVYALSRSNRPPCSRCSSMTDDLPKAFKIVGYESATVPSPSQYLYNALALRAWNDYKEQMEPHIGHTMPTWDELPNKLKLVWLGVAHGQHGVIAWLAGGRIEEIKDGT